MKTTATNTTDSNLRHEPELSGEESSMQRMGGPRESDRRTPLARARDEWLDSEEGVRACNAATLGNTDPNYYLRNRLQRAFLAGVEAVNRGYTTEKRPTVAHERDDEAKPSKRNEL